MLDMHYDLNYGTVLLHGKRVGKYIPEISREISLVVCR